MSARLGPGRGPRRAPDAPAIQRRGSHAGTGHHDRRRSMSAPGVSPGECAAPGCVSPGETGGGVRRASRAPADAVASHSAGTPTGAPAGGDRDACRHPRSQPQGHIEVAWPRRQTVANQVEPRRQGRRSASSSLRIAMATSPGLRARRATASWNPRSRAPSTSGAVATEGVADPRSQRIEPRRPRRKDAVATGRAFLVAPQQVRQRGGKHPGDGVAPGNGAIVRTEAEERLGECHGRTMPAGCYRRLNER